MGTGRKIKMRMLVVVVPAGLSFPVCFLQQGPRREGGSGVFGSGEERIKKWESCTSEGHFGQIK